MDPVRRTTTRGVLTLTLSDVENRNALGGALVQGLYDAIADANADPAIRAVVVTNEGNTFCAGANLKQQGAGAMPGVAATVGLDELLRSIQTSSTPILGRIAGHVVGGGNGLAAALDVSIAADDVKFGFTEVRLGVAPAIISVVCLPKLRRGDALEAFLRGHRFSAARAAEMGLINRAVPRDQLDTSIEEVLADLRLGGPKALGAAKRLVYEVPNLPQDDAFRQMSRLSAELFRSQEAAEGIAAFAGRRPPAWAVDDDA
jgi:methylglutaconyl-CoA hydratase